MSEPTKKPREWWLADGLYLEGEPWPYGEQIHVREVDLTYDAMVVAMAEALEKQPQILYESLLKTTAFLGITEGKRAAFVVEEYDNIKFIINEALARYREWENK